MKRFFIGAILVSALTTFSHAIIPVAHYRFEGNYAPDDPLAPALVPVRPELQTFLTDTVTVGAYSGSRTVLDRAGNGDNQSGLELVTTAILPNPNVYTLELVMSFADQAGYKRILNTNNASDNGFYVLNNELNLYPVTNGPTPLALGVSNYHHVVLSTDGSTVQAYLNGAPQIDAVSTSMQNPNDLLRLFLDDNAVGGEYAPGRVAVARLYSEVLSPSQVADRARNPFLVPEPAAGVVMFAVAATLLGYRLRKWN